MGIDEDEVVEALETYHAYSTRSLSQPLGGGADDETMEDLLGETEQGYEEVEYGVLVEAGLEALDTRERTIVEMRFFEGLTQSEIAARIGHLPDARLAPAPARARDDARAARDDRGGAAVSTVRLTMPAKPST